MECCYQAKVVALAHHDLKQRDVLTALQVSYPTFLCSQYAIPSTDRGCPCTRRKTQGVCTTLHGSPSCATTGYRPCIYVLCHISAMSGTDVGPDTTRSKHLGL
eukprot:3107450-Rhodomonas_salina.6